MSTGISVVEVWLKMMSKNVFLVKDMIHKPVMLLLLQYHHFMPHRLDFSASLGISCSSSLLFRYIWYKIVYLSVYMCCGKSI
jgi:hypothetical protein